MRLKFHHDTELESVIVRCPLENYQLLSEYQRKYPKAEIDEVLDGREDFNRLIRGKGFRLEDRETVNLLRFLNGQEVYLTHSEQEKVARVLPSCHRLEEAMEAICNLDCFQLNADGSVEQKKAFSYRYQANQGLPPVGQTAAHTVKAFFQGKPEIRWLFLPMTEEKERHLKKQLGLSSWAGHSVELVTLEPAMLGAYLPSTGHTVATLQQLATILQQPEFQQKAVQERCAAALLVQQPQNLQEACRVLERNQNYVLSQQKTQDSVQTKFGYLNLHGEAPLHPLENELVTSWIYGKVYAEYHERSYGYEEDEIFPWGPRELSPYLDEIREQIVQEVLPEEQGRGLAHYLHNELLNRKVYQISPDVVVENGMLWSKTKVESYGPLNTTELEAVKDYLQGQFSDGWGEGFCQREIPISDEEALFVYFYPFERGSDPTLYNEEEFAQLLGMEEPELRM